MEVWQIVSAIAEMRSYIASDWPSKEERMRLYGAIRQMEAQLKEHEDKQKEAEET